MLPASDWAWAKGTPRSMRGDHESGLVDPAVTSGVGREIIEKAAAGAHPGEQGQQHGTVDVAQRRDDFAGQAGGLATEHHPHAAVGRHPPKRAHPRPRSPVR
jgi:hypothetical protein